MPYITITTNKTIDKDLELELKKGLGELIEIFNGKTEKLQRALLRIRF